MEQAAAAHQQALAADPSWVPAAVALAQALGSLNQPEQAVGVLQQAQQQLLGRPFEAGALQSADIQVSGIATVQTSTGLPELRRQTWCTGMPATALWALPV